MIEKTQTEIMKNWYSNENPIVSICCLTYNHGDYIEEAIDGFLIQQTNFPFEIIIHDDASTDNTADKIKAYAKKYPHIIKTIFQTENQYSQEKKVFYFAVNKSKGKYLAMCEGDDYWLDAKKLQIQIDLMEKNPDCNISFHTAEVRLKHAKEGTVLAQHSKKNHIFSTSEIILGGGGFCPTASIVLKRETVRIHQNFFENIQIGDYFFQILGSLNGGALYINKVMSVYRKGVEVSWSSQMKNINKQEEFYCNKIESLDKLNLYLDNKYQKEIDIMKSESHYEISLAYFDNKMYKNFQKTIEKSYDLYKLNSLSYLVFYYLRYFPYLINFLKRIKGID